MKNTKIAERIKELRQVANLTQAEFGMKIGVSQDTISLWEQGKSIPAVEYIILMVETFKANDPALSSDYLLGLID
ncbi:MAG: helix-turn-helix transcriptional regulator [Clostridiales bacterium]|nr:helix-turn-helix transcriptional regulator [Clostridiales bacterium]